MNRLNNALRQRDAAREEALLAAEKLNKLQVWSTAQMSWTSAGRLARRVVEVVELVREQEASNERVPWARPRT